MNYSTDTPTPYIWCPACGSSEFAELGVLGHLTWIRCRDCGLDVSVEAEEVQP